MKALYKKSLNSVMDSKKRVIFFLVITYLK